MLQPLEFFARAHFDFWRPLCRRKGFLELVYNFSELINETTPLSWQGGRFFLTTLEKNQHFSKMYEMAESYVERFRGYYYKSFDKGIYKKYHSLWKYFCSNMMHFWNVRVLGARVMSLEIRVFLSEFPWYLYGISPRTVTRGVTRIYEVLEEKNLIFDFWATKLSQLHSIEK